MVRVCCYWQNINGVEQEYNSWIHDGENLIYSHQFSQSANLGEWNPRIVWRNFETPTHENSKSDFFIHKTYEIMNTKRSTFFLGRVTRGDIISVGGWE